MKKIFGILITSLFLLSGCSQNASDKANVNYPYEITDGISTLSYYDTEDAISIDDFTILEYSADNIIGIRNRSDNCIIVRDGVIRSIFIVDEDIVTYKGISVGDSVDKIENAFSEEYQLQDSYSIIYNEDAEEVSIEQEKEENWIWIIYYTDGTEITSIQIYDVKFATTLL